MKKCTRNFIMRHCTMKIITGNFFMRLFLIRKYNELYHQIIHYKPMYWGHHMMLLPRERQHGLSSHLCHSCCWSGVYTLPQKHCYLYCTYLHCYLYRTYLHSSLECLCITRGSISPMNTSELHSSARH